MSAAIDPGLAEAIRACGSRPALARKIGMSHYTVNAWHRVPQPWLPAVSLATGFGMRALRSDLWCAQ